jgi:glycolate oxidase subunit GlcD
MLSDSLLVQLQAIIPQQRILQGNEDLITYGRDWLKDYTANPSCIVLPESIDEVQRIVHLCNENSVAIVPSGGRTGLSGGATATNGEIILSLERMNKVLSVNRSERTITCQAGAVTEKIQQRALEEGLFFPIDFASKGSSQIGGNIATNAGGIRVIRYGMLRNWVLGLTVVTGDGSLLRLNGSLIKNQSGYDLRQLIVGSEGTLAIVVEATLLLTNPPQNSIRTLCALSNPRAAITVLERMRDTFGTVNVFEYIDSTSIEKVISHHNLPRPCSSAADTYALIEVDETPTGLENLEKVLEQAAETDLITDASIAMNSKQGAELVKYRELISETLSSMHTLHKNDVSVAPSDIPVFLERYRGELNRMYPDFEIAIFGHIGDGNLHVNILKPASMDDEDFYAACHEVDRILFNIVREFSGSISAEHGVGLLKRDFLHYTRSETEINIMRGIKNVFDPNKILNPGKIFYST